MERYRTTLILAGVLVVLAGLAFFLNGRNAATGSETPTPQPATYVWQIGGAISSIDVMSGTQTVSLRQDLSTTVWSLVAPIKETADPFSVGNQADQLKNLQATATLTDTSNLAQYGLDKPGLTVKIGAGDPVTETHTLNVGSATV